MNEYEFQKLNADFDKKLDRLSEEYKRKTDEIFHADRYGLNMEKRRNRLWMWFDRKTGYQLIPKIVIISFLVTLGSSRHRDGASPSIQHGNSFLDKSGCGLPSFGSYVRGRNPCAISCP